MTNGQVITLMVALGLIGGASAAFVGWMTWEQRHSSMFKHMLFGNGILSLIIFTATFIVEEALASVLR